MSASEFVYRCCVKQVLEETDRLKSLPKLDELVTGLTGILSSEGYEVKIVGEKRFSFAFEIMDEETRGLVLGYRIERGRMDVMKLQNRIKKDEGWLKVIYRRVKEPNKESVIEVEIRASGLDSTTAERLECYLEKYCSSSDESWTHKKQKIETTA